MSTAPAGPHPGASRGEDSAAVDASLSAFGSEAAAPTLAAIAEALNRRGENMPPQVFLEVLRDAVGTTRHTLTQGERDFLLANSDLDADDLTEEAHAATTVSLARDKLAADHLALENTLTTKEVAALLDRAESNVRRSRLSGNLYAISPGDGGGLRFPRWQFTADRTVVPGLKAVLRALPPSFHPALVERFMLTSDEALADMNPVQWLASGGSVNAVVELAEGLHAL